MTVEEATKTAENGETGDTKAGEKGDKKAEEPAPAEELSEEDKKLKDELSMLVSRLEDADHGLHKPALESLRSLIRSSTASMTSVPKPLKFLREQFPAIKAAREKMPDVNAQRFCADILSVLSMTSSTERECLRYRLLGSNESIADWGHEYVRHLSGEVTQEWNDGKWELARDGMLKLSTQIVDFFMHHNAEPEACDLLMEIEQLELIDTIVDEISYEKICLYLTSCVPFVAEPEDSNLLRTAIRLYRKFDRPSEALRYAIRLQDLALLRDIFVTTRNRLIQRQMAYMLGQSQVYLKLDEETTGYEEFMEIMTNAHLNSSHLALARELDITAPKSPDDVYKKHLENQRATLGIGTNLDAAKQNLANSFVNGLVNCAFGKDTVFTSSEEGNKWLHKHKDHGMVSAAASLGLILLWDVDSGLTEIDKYLYSPEETIRSGAMLACGIVNARIKNDCDPALALLSDNVLDKSMVIRSGSIIGLGIAYAGTNREDVIQVLMPVLDDPKSSLEIKAYCSVSLGLIAVGTCHAELTERILQLLSSLPQAAVLKEPSFRYLALGLGLLYLGRQEATDAVREALNILSEPFRSLREAVGQRRGMVR